MTDKKFNVAVVGAGAGSAPHLASLTDLQDHVTVRYLIARSVERAGPLAKTLPHAKVSLDLDEALNDAQIEAVLLLTPANTHLELGSRIAAAGKHLLVEKPIDLTTAKAFKLVAVCEQRGIVAAAVLQHRTRSASRKLRQLLEQGALGEVHGASVSIPWWRSQAYYDEPGRGTWARDGGGVLMTQAIHTLDLFLWLLGSPSEVFAYAITSSAHRMECEDTVVGVMKYATGCVASLYASTASFPGFPESIAFNGAKGTAMLTAGKLTVHFTDGTRLEEGEEAALGSGADHMAFSHQSHRAIIANFVDATSGSVEPVASLRSALEVHFVIDALLASSAHNRPMPVQSNAVRTLRELTALDGSRPDTER